MLPLPQLQIWRACLLIGALDLRPATQPERSSGKSTALEAVAALCRLLVSGGGRNELGAAHGPEQESTLASALRPVFRQQPRDGYFLRAEFHAHFASLSPQRQLALLALMMDLVNTGEAQFIIATHSPILMTFPGAEILSFDDSAATALRPVRLEETSHFQVTRGILDAPERYRKHLRDPE